MKHKEILDKMFSAMEDKVESRRTYLGMSTFDTHCDRKQWLEFRHTFDPKPNYQSVSHFSDGHRSEEILIERLLAAGIDLRAKDENGNQFEYKDMYWLRGHTDGEIKLDVTAVWEAKSSDDVKRAKLKKLIEEDEHSALEKWDKNYYAQAQLYMGYSGKKKHILMACAHGAREKLNSKGDHRTVIVETLFNQEKFDELKHKANDIIVSDTIPEAAWSLQYDKPLCVWKNGKCEAYDYCKGNHIGKPNCRNCGYCEFTTEGANCTKSGDALNEKEMVEFKECHKYHPNIIHWMDLVEMDDDGNVHYRDDSGTDWVNVNSMDFYEEVNK